MRSSGLKSDEGFKAFWAAACCALISSRCSFFRRLRSLRASRHKRNLASKPLTTVNRLAVRASSHSYKPTNEKFVASNSPVAAKAISSTVAPTVLRPLANPRETSVPTTPPGCTLESNSGRIFEIESSEAAAKVSTKSPSKREKGARKLKVLNRRHAAATNKQGSR